MYENQQILEDVLIMHYYIGNVIYLVQFDFSVQQLSYETYIVFS